MHDFFVKKSTVVLFALVTLSDEQLVPVLCTFPEMFSKDPFITKLLSCAYNEDERQITPVNKNVLVFMIKFILNELFVS
jgi:hypothetical protein